MKVQVIQVHVVVMMISALVTLCMVSEKTPSATGLVDKYTQALDSTSSFIHQFVKTTEFSYHLQSGSSCKGKSFGRGQVRHDNQGIYLQIYSWGDFNSHKMDLPETEPAYGCKIINDNMYYNNSKFHDTLGTATWMSRPEGEQTALNKTPGISPMLGYLGSKERLDEVLRNSESISIREQKEMVEGVHCFVIEAKTKYGQYKIWLDPEYGYHPAKILRYAEEGEYSSEHLLKKGETAKSYIKNVRFEQIDGVWIPVEADTGSNNDTSEGWFSKEDTHYKRTDIILNPDHEKLGSFADPLYENPANDPELQDGTRVLIVNDPKEYTWQDGKVVDSVGKVVLEPSGHKSPPEQLLQKK